MQKQFGFLIVGLVVLAGFAIMESPSASAATFSTNVRVNDLVHADQVNPAIAVDGTGRIHAAWEDYRNGASNPAIFYSSAADGGKLFSTSIAVTAPLTGTENQRYPSVAVSDDGLTIVVVWTDLVDSKIYYVRSTDGAQTFGPKVALSSSLAPIASFFTSQILYRNGGGSCLFHVIWSVNDIARSTGVGIWFSESTNCGQTFSSESRAQTDGAEAALAVAPDGALAIAFVLAPSNTPEIYLTVRVGGTWQTSELVSDVDGPLGSRNPTVGFSLPIIVGGPYTLEVAWEDSRAVSGNNNWDIYFRLFTFGQIANGASIRVNQDGTTQPQRQPWVSVDAAGNPFIALTSWQAGGTDSDIYFAQSSDHGSTFSIYQKVNDDPTTQPQSTPMIAQRIDDASFHAFWVVWQDDRTTANGYDVYITGDGLPVLNWCGTPGYTSDGVDPDSGDIFTTFTYCVLYRSPVGDAPLSGNPRLTILRNGLPLMSNLPMTPPPTGSWAGATGDYRAGRRYIYATTLDNGCAVAAFSYAFDATDIMGRAVPASLVGTGPAYAPRFATLDISGTPVGNDHRIAVGWDRCVSLFSALNGGGGPYRTEAVGFVVDHVVVSGDGTYLAVLGNDRPFSQTSGSHLRLYGQIQDPSQPWPLLYQVDLGHSATAGGRPIDITRDGQFVAVGTGWVDWNPIQAVGDVYLFRTPATPGPPTTYQNPWNRWILSLRFGGNSNSASGNLAVGSTRTGIVGDHSLGFFAYGTNQGNFFFVQNWQTDTGDPSFSVALNAASSRLAVGTGHFNQILFYDTSGTGTRLWSGTADLGTTHSLSITDTSYGNSYYIGSGSVRDQTFGDEALALTSGTDTAGTRLLTYEPDPTSQISAHAELAVQTQAQYLAGCWTTHAYYWTTATPPVGPLDRHDNTLGANCVDIVITFAGAYSALVETDGTVQLYAVDATGGTLRWSLGLP